MMVFLKVFLYVGREIRINFSGVQVVYRSRYVGEGACLAFFVYRLQFGFVRFLGRFWRLVVNFGQDRFQYCSGLLSFAFVMERCIFGLDKDKYIVKSFFTNLVGSGEVGQSCDSFFVGIFCILWKFYYFSFLLLDISSVSNY